MWDEQEETAVQSPAGGTKIAWGGPPVAPKHGRNRQRLELSVTSGSPSYVVERLLALGASLLPGAGDSGDAEVELADPDGNEFHLLTG